MTTTPARRLSLTDRFRTRFPELSLEMGPAVLPRPELVALNETLADELGLDITWLESEEGTGFLAGATVVEGSHPVAMAYAGHQFGGYSPRLGDGRAVLLGEVTTASGDLVDLHLKGLAARPLPVVGTERRRWAPCCASS